MSKTTVTFSLCALSLALLAGCSGDDDDSDPNTISGSGGSALSGVVATGGGTTAASAGSGGVSAAGNGGSAIAGSGGDASGVAGMSATGASSGEATFTRVWSEVLSRKSCNSAFCHGMGQGNLSMLTKDNAYLNLVNMPAAGPKCGMSGMLRVKPSDPAQSLLLDKLSNALPACGDPMPIGTKFPPNCLSSTPQVCNTEQETTLVRDWIAAGAIND